MSDLACIAAFIALLPPCSLSEPKEGAWSLRHPNWNSLSWNLQFPPENSGSLLEWLSTPDSCFLTFHFKWFCPLCDLWPRIYYCILTIVILPIAHFPLALSVDGTSFAGRSRNLDLEAVVWCTCIGALYLKCPFKPYRSVLRQISCLIYFVFLFVMVLPSSACRMPSSLVFYLLQCEKKKKSFLLYFYGIISLNKNNKCFDLRVLLMLKPQYTRKNALLDFSIL